MNILSSNAFKELKIFSVLFHATLCLLMSFPHFMSSTLINRINLGLIGSPSAKMKTTLKFTIASRFRNIHFSSKISFRVKIVIKLTGFSRTLPFTVVYIHASLFLQDKLFLLLLFQISFPKNVLKMTKFF